jgi:O-antigen/teichoic acid export membrane protein
MGIVKKQAYKNTIVAYTGMVVAYVNTVLLFPQIIGNEQYGFYNLIISVSVLYSLIASMGVPSILAKFFPFYRTADKTHNGLIHWAAGLAFLTFIIATLVYILFKPLVVAAYANNSPLFIHYYYYIIPLAFFVVAFNFLEMSGRIVYQTIYSNILQTIVLRLITTLLLILMARKWIDFNQFILLYIGSNGLISLLLLISLAISKDYSHRLHDPSFKAIKKKEILHFGMFTLVSSAIYVLLQKVDTLMLSAMAGDAVQGVYTWYFNIAMVISVPAQALSRTTYAIVADSWKTKNMANITEVYYKTSIVQMLIGCLLFIGIFINRDNLFAIVNNKDFTDPKYFNLFLVIGLGFLFDITGGLNTYIITTSHKYRLMTLFVLVASIFCISLNYVLIPLYKGLGAAISYMLTIGLLNFGSWFYIKYRFKMQPFTNKHLLVIVIATASYFAGHYVWKMPNVYVDIFVRSVITTIVYGALTYILRISEDVNDKVDHTILRFLKRHH